MLACKLAEGGKVAKLHLVGELDPKHRQTFDLVMQLDGTDAGTLMREYGEAEAVTRTAWNNRLAALASMGLVVESSHGRAKRYMPVLQEA
jgi:hypothetical protein